MARRQQLVGINICYELMGTGGIMSGFCAPCTLMKIRTVISSGCSSVPIPGRGLVVIRAEKGHLGGALDLMCKEQVTGNL